VQLVRTVNEDMFTWELTSIDRHARMFWHVGPYEQSAIPLASVGKPALSTLNNVDKCLYLMGVYGMEWSETCFTWKDFIRFWITYVEDNPL
jgi:hypothetical protein